MTNLSNAATITFIDRHYRWQCIFTQSKGHSCVASLSAHFGGPLLLWISPPRAGFFTSGLRLPQQAAAAGSPNSQPEAWERQRRYLSRRRRNHLDLLRSPCAHLGPFPQYAYPYTPAGGSRRVQRPIRRHVCSSTPSIWTCAAQRDLVRTSGRF
jgi:hypothetical protein